MSSISSIRIENFKGIAGETEIELRPITFFVGANSSGKSSAIHALGALSQTVTLPNNDRALVLDDDYADVHLGQFADIVHTQDKSDQVRFNLDFKGIQIPHKVDESFEFRDTSVNVDLCFGYDQEREAIYLDSATYKIGMTSFEMRRVADNQYDWLVDGDKISEGLTSQKFFMSMEAMMQVAQDTETNSVTMIMIHQNIVSILERVKYLGPFRLSPSRRYPTRGAKPREVGAEGQNAITMLANETIASSRSQRIEQISGWLNSMGLGKSVDIQRLSGSDLVEPKLELEDGGRYTIADLGFGISQVLPVLVQLSYASDGDLLLFEQPELHLHSIASRKLASIFAEVAKEKNVKVVAETHSPDLIKQICSEVRAGNISTEDFIIYRVSRCNGSSCFEVVEMDEEGDIYQDWENGISMP